LEPKRRQTTGCPYINRTGQKNFNKCCQPSRRADGRGFIENKSSIDGRIHAIRFHSNVRSVP
jgi:hypothetical protein